MAVPISPTPITPTGSPRFVISALRAWAMLPSCPLLGKSIACRGAEAPLGGPMIDELRRRIAATGLPIPEARLNMIDKLMTLVLAPIHGEDWRAANTLEPVVTFDAAGPGGGAASAGAGPRADARPQAAPTAPASASDDLAYA